MNWVKTSWTYSILDVNLKSGTHESSKMDDLICLRHFSRSTSPANLGFFTWDELWGILLIFHALHFNIVKCSGRYSDGEMDCREIAEQCWTSVFAWLLYKVVAHK